MNNKFQVFLNASVYSNNFISILYKYTKANSRIIVKLLLSP